MDLQKKAKPSGVCNLCQAPTSRREALNHRCAQVVNGRRCSGTVKSAMNALWLECDSCRAAGTLGTQQCTECAGFGWRLYA
jgi:primosomal protein N'